MSVREIAINFFKIVKIKELADSYYRVTIENEYVKTNDIDIIMAFSVAPIEGQRIMLTMESV